jgi:hypothetical protein
VIGAWVRSRSVVLFSVATAAVATASCGASADSRDTEIDRIARQYVELVTALADRDPDSASGDAAIIRVTRPAGARRRALSTIAVEARAAADEVRQLATAPEERREWLIAQLTAVAARASIQSGAKLTFKQEFLQLFGTPPPEQSSDESATEPVRRGLDTLLPGAGTPAARLAAFEGQMAVPAARLPSVFHRALEECRTKTLARLALPPDERVDVAFVSGRPWSAFSTYLGKGRSRIDVNTSYSLTVDRVLELACHEGYPGHHVINLLREQRALGGSPELGAVPLFSPDSFKAEVAATQAASMLFTDDDRIAVERDDLFPLAGLPPAEAARHVTVSRLLDRLSPAVSDALTRYLSGDRDFIETGWALQDDALMAYPQATLLFANRFRGFALAYAWSRHDPAETWRWYSMLVNGEAASSRSSSRLGDEQVTYSPDGDHSSAHSLR